MNLFDAVILSIIEGITEFLPVSSTGHLMLAARFLQIPASNFATTFEIVIQMGAILAVLYLYGIKEFLKLKSLVKIIAGFMPSAVIGVLFYKFIKEYLLSNPLVPVITLLLGGIVLIFLDKIINRFNKNKDLSNITYKEAILIGLFQTISIIPGVSRSAATIIGGMILGFNKKSSAEFSFLLAVPTIFAASVLDLTESRLNFSQTEFYYLSLGIILSFLFSLIGIKFLVGFLQKHSFAVFGYYRILIALLFYIFVLS